jgi:hypothetical protein
LKRIFSGFRPVVFGRTPVNQRVANYCIRQYIGVGGPNGFQSLVQFDLTTLPARTTVAGVVNISVVNGSCTEGGVNGNNALQRARRLASGVSVAAAGDYLYVDAAAAVRSWLSETTNSAFLSRLPTIL